MAAFLARAHGRRVVQPEIEMSLKRLSQATNHDPVFGKSTEPLGLADRRFVKDALADVAPDWTVDLHGICDHEASLILLPQGADDAMGPSFVISRDCLGFRLDQLHWDEVREVGTYPALADVVSAVEMRLITGPYLSAARH